MSLAEELRRGAEAALEIKNNNFDKKYANLKYLITNCIRYNAKHNMAKKLTINVPQLISSLGMSIRSNIIIADDPAISTYTIDKPLDDPASHIMDYLKEQGLEVTNEDGILHLSWEESKAEEVIEDITIPWKYFRDYISPILLLFVVFFFKGMADLVIDK